MRSKVASLNLLLCAVLHGLNHYLMIFFKPTYTVMTEYFNITNVGDITTRMTIFYVGYGASNFISGFLARRYSLKGILFFGMLLMSVSSMAVIFITPDKFHLLVVLIVLMGLGGGVYHPAANTLITASYEGRLGHAIGMLSIGSATGLAIAPFVGEYIGVKLIGFKELFFISGSVALIFSVVFYILVEDKGPVNAVIKTSAQNTDVLPYGKLLLFSIFLICIPAIIRETVSSSFYEITPFWVKYGHSYGITIAYVQMMQYAPGIIVQPITGKLCDKLNPLRMVIITFVCLGAGFILFACSGAFMLWTALILFGIGMSSSTVANETFMASIVAGKERPLIFGIVISAGIGIGGVMAGFAGRVVDAFGKESASGYRIWFVIMGMVVILSSAIYYLVDRLRRRGV